MKKYALVVWILVLVICMSVNNAEAQIGLRKGIKVGSNWANVSNVNVSDTESLQALTFGFSLELRILNLVAVQGDLLYSPKGVTVAGEETKLNYFSVPVVLKKFFFPVGIHPYIFGGPEFSFLLSAKKIEEDIKEYVNSGDTGIVIGGGIEFSFLGKSAYAEGRYSFGLSEVIESGLSIEGAKNKVAQIYFGILF
ncbi:MAG: porin family protein [bacterium]